MMPIVSEPPSIVSTVWHRHCRLQIVVYHISYITLWEYEYNVWNFVDLLSRPRKWSQRRRWGWGLGSPRPIPPEDRPDSLGQRVLS